MKKNILLFLCFFGTVLLAIAQPDYKPASEAQQKEMMQKITASSEQLKTLRCDFVQRKTISILSEEMVSEGRMFFKQKDKLKWEYTKPYPYEFVMNGDKVMVASDKTKNGSDANPGKLFRRIAKMIVALIQGSDIMDASKFSTQCMVGGKDNMVILTPKQKELKQMFKAFRLRFNTTDYTVNSVEMEELNGDITIIEMKNKQINKEMSDEIFSVKMNNE